MARVLLVEDNELNRDMLSRRLEKEGHTLLIATNGLEALHLANEEQPDIILMDMNLPEMDGWEATRQLKNHPATQSIPVIALTAHAMRGDRERAIAAGFHNYLTKPLTATTFMDELLKLLLDIPELSEYLSV